MKVIRETIVAGRTIMTRVKASTRIKTAKGEKRQAKKNPTPEAVRRVNLNNAIWHLTSILNHNFHPGDWHITLTYKDEASPEEAKKKLQNFLRNIKNYCRKNEIEWKWIAVTEYENHRIHHHVVCSGLDPAIIESRWKEGFVNFKAMDRSGNYINLAEYLIKETEKTFRLPESVNRKRYSSSGTIVIPETKREQMSERALTGELKANKGYHINQDTVRRYEHAILEVECVEYIQESIDDDPRLKRWNKGKAVRTERKYKESWEVQECMF